MEKEERKKISIFGVSPFSDNRGVCGMCMATIDILQKTNPNCQLTVVMDDFSKNDSSSFFSKKYKNDKGVELIEFAKRRDEYLFKCIIGLSLSVIWNFFSHLKINLKNILHKTHIIRPFLESDVDIVISGGDGFTDKYGIRLVVGIFPKLIILSLLNKQVVFFPQTIGPFNNIIIRSVAKFILDNAKYIFVREEISKEYLKEMNVSSQKIFVIPDTVFALDAVPSRDIDTILKEEQVNLEDKYIIGVSLRDLRRDLFVSKYIDTTTSKKYVDIMCKIIDYICNHYNVVVLLIPYQGMRDVRDTTKYITQEVFGKLKHKDKVYSISKREYTIEELKGICGKCDLFIGTYMHANISAISMCVPTIGISHSHKYEGIMKMFGLENYVWNHNKNSYEDLVSKVDEAWINREKIKKELEARMPEVKKQVMFAGELVKKVLNEQESK